MTQYQKMRKTYTPIMLTSKSIVPVFRVNHDKSNRNGTKNQRYRLKESDQDIDSYLQREGNAIGIAPFSRKRQRFLKQEQYKSQLYPDMPHDTEQLKFIKMIKKAPSPAVVTVEFLQEKTIKLKKQPINFFNWSKEQFQFETRKKEPIESDQIKMINFSNSKAKTFDNFAKLLKQKPNQRDIVYRKETLRKEKQSTETTEWKKYLDKYYMSIRRVRPLHKKQESLRQKISVEKSVISRMKMESRVQEREYEKFQELVRYKSTSEMPSGERANLQQKEQFYSTKQNEIFKLIYNDMNEKKIGSAHKKEFFVFGMGESNKSNQNTLRLKFQFYQDFIFKVNFTHNLYVNSREDSEKTFKLSVGFGNNSALIKGIIRRRFWWQILDKNSTEDPHFVWTQLKITEVFKKQKNRKQQTRNSFRGRPIQKVKSEINIIGETQQSKILLNEKQKNKSIMNEEDYGIWKKHCLKNNKCEQKINQQTYIKRLNDMLKKKTIDIIENPFKTHMHNHLQCNYFLGNKKALFYSMRKYYELLEKNPFDFIPLTFHISQGLSDCEFDKFLVEYEKINAQRKSDKQLRNIWIIKPGELTNRGKGITVCATLDEIKIRLKSKQKNWDGKNRTFILQKYIQKPLLYNKRKFDIRHYMVMNCVNGKFYGYWYEEGYIRTTSYEYNIKNCKDLYTHLTNDAVQQHGQDYGKYQKGNKLSYPDFQKYLKNVKHADFYAKILPTMKKLASDSLKATYSILDPERKEHNFQLFGLDFMLDEDLNVYLIEVNTNPCLQTSCPLLNKIITALIENVFKLCVDPIFPPPFEWPAQKKFSLGENALEENKFSLIFDENEEGPRLKELYKNVSKLDEKMGQIEEEDEEYKDEESQWNQEITEDIKNVENKKM